jgi:predicted dehydrogenase
MKFLIAGCGSIGKRHLNNLQLLGMTDLVAFDTQDDRCLDVANRFGVPVVSNFEEGLKHKPDVVLICTPTSLHTDYAIRSAQAGIHLFIEKPIAHELAGLDQLLHIIDERRLKILVGCNFRFERGMRKLKSLLGEGAIGKVLGGRVVFGQYLPDWHPREDYRQGYSARRALGGGILLDAVHEVDYIRWLIGEVSAVSCFMSKVSDLEIDVEDHADLMIEFANGLTAQLHLDYLQRAYQRSLEIYGSEGTLKWSFQDRAVEWFSASDKTWQIFNWKQDPAYTVDEMYLAEMQHLIDCVNDKVLPTLDGVGGRRVLQIILAAKKSAQTGRVVSL